MPKQNNQNKKRNISAIQTPAVPLKNNKRLKQPIKEPEFKEPGQVIKKKHVSSFAKNSGA